MTKDSPWHYPVLSLPREPLLSAAWQLLELQISRFKRSLARNASWRWLVTLGAIAAVGLWNWQLLLAGGTGILSTVLVYQIQTGNWQRLGLIRNGLRCSNRLVLAVGAGGIVALATPVAAAVWLDVKSPWIAAGIILQGFGTTAILILLLWQTLHGPGGKEDSSFNQQVANLTHPDPLKRLVAVHQLQYLVENSRSDCKRDRRIAEYFRLMLRREPEVLIQEAILDGLQAIENSQKLNQPKTYLLTNSIEQAKLKARQPSKPS